MIADWRLLACRLKMNKNERTSAEAQGDSVKLVDLALKVLEYEYLAQSAPSLQIFAWHLQNRQPRRALILLLGELRLRTTGPQVDKSWIQVERCLVAHPVLLRSDKGSWTWHLECLILEAWDQREKGRRQQHLQPVMPPHFISQLRRQHAPGIDTADLALTPALPSTTSASWEVYPPTGISSIKGIPDPSAFDSPSNFAEPWIFCLIERLDRITGSTLSPLLCWTGFSGTLLREAQTLSINAALCILICINQWTGVSVRGE